MNEDPFAGTPSRSMLRIDAVPYFLLEKREENIWGTAIHRSDTGVLESGNCRFLRFVWREGSRQTSVGMTSGLCD